MTFAEDDEVLVRYPRDRREEDGDRTTWPWLPGTVLARVGPDEWQVVVEDPALAEARDGELWYPTCYRGATELRPAP